MRSCLSLLLLGACTAQAPERPYALWTIDDILEAAEKDWTYAGIPGPMVASPAGGLIGFESPPFAATPTRAGGDLPGLAVLPSFSEGQPAAYLVSEIWEGYEDVWVQPMYVAVTAFDEKSPFANRLPGSRPVFGVDVQSAFYSPYWEIFYYVVPPGTPPDRYRSAEQILDDGLELHPGPGIFCALSHRRFEIATPEGVDEPRRPLNGDAIGAAVTDQDWGWVEGKKVWLLTLGPDNFAWNEERYVQETPLFRLARRDGSGEARPLPIPSVGGTGPIGSHTPPDVRGGVPRFGALWRMVDVLAPDDAVVAIAGDLPGLRAEIEATGLGTRTVTLDLLADDRVGDVGPDPGDYTGRVARNPACFDSAATFPDACEFLDSQDAIEELASQSFFVRDVLVACPFVEWTGAPVP